MPRRQDDPDDYTYVLWPLLKLRGWGVDWPEGRERFYIGSCYECGGEGWLVLDRDDDGDDYPAVLIEHSRTAAAGTG